MVGSDAFNFITICGFTYTTGVSCDRVCVYISGEFVRFYSMFVGIVL